MFKRFDTVLYTDGTVFRRRDYNAWFGTESGGYKYSDDQIQKALDTGLAQMVELVPVKSDS